MKIILKVNGERLLAMWLREHVVDNYPFVVATSPGVEHKVGAIIKDWYWGKYFNTIDDALKYFNEEEK